MTANPYGGHTLNKQLEQVERLCIKKRAPRRSTWTWDIEVTITQESGP
jgi:hypothetical protein